MSKETSVAQKSIHTLLKKVGLDDKQTEIYLALLSLKSAKASDVAVLAKQSRSHTYLILRQLEEMGLVSEVEEGKVLRFIAESPERILSYLHQREQEYKDLQKLVEGAMPLLSSMGDTTYVGAPRVTIQKGLDGMKQIYRDVFAHEFIGLYNAQASFDMFGDNIVTMLFGKGAQLRGRDLLVNNDGAKRYCKEVKQHDAYIVKLLPEGMNFKADTMVYGDNVTMFAFDDERTTIRIQNKHIADSFRSWFEVLWGLSQDTQ